MSVEKSRPPSAGGALGGWGLDLTRDHPIGYNPFTMNNRYIIAEKVKKVQPQQTPEEIAYWQSIFPHLKVASSFDERRGVRDIPPGSRRPEGRPWVPVVAQGSAPGGLYFPTWLPRLLTVLWAHADRKGVVKKPASFLAKELGISIRQFRNYMRTIRSWKIKPFTIIKNKSGFQGCSILRMRFHSQFLPMVNPDPNTKAINVKEKNNNRRQLREDSIKRSLMFQVRHACYRHPILAELALKGIDLIRAVGYFVWKTKYKLKALWSLAEKEFLDFLWTCRGWLHGWRTACYKISLYLEVQSIGLR